MTSKPADAIGTESGKKVELDNEPATEPTGTKKALDGMTAAAYAAYLFSENAFIYPITPASHMSETIESWAVAGKKNLFGMPVHLEEMQSEKGASGGVHGSLAGGALTSTFTASQGLMLMISNMYKISGELLPGVFHITTRSLAAHALSIFGDHQDIMAVRATGFAMLGSSSPQECMDMSLIAHASAIKGSLPFVHFMDGFRTSDCIETVETISPKDMATFLDRDRLHEFRARALEPLNPYMRGTAQNADIYFQNREASNAFYDGLPGIVQGYMDQLAKLTGRSYHLFDYVGALDAEHIVVSMGSSCDAIEETVRHLNECGQKVGAIKVRLYRPFATEVFLAALPKTVKTITALDRTKEPGSQGEPLFQDVCSAIVSAGMAVRVLGGRYGLSSKELSPAMVKAVFDNASSSHPKSRFTVGIEDDVTELSLEVGEPIHLLGDAVKQCIFWGFGSDGTVGANKQAAKIIGDAAGKFVQGYFQFDSKKSGGLTRSYLRFADDRLKAPYLIDEADYIACHKDIYATRDYPMLDALRKGGIFVLNCRWSDEELSQKLAPSIKAAIAKKKARFFAIDATKVAEQSGAGNHINMIMQVIFFKLSDVMDFSEAVSLLKNDVQELYGRYGQDVVQADLKSIDSAIDGLREVKYPSSWADATGAGAWTSEVMSQLESAGILSKNSDNSTGEEPHGNEHRVSLERRGELPPVQSLGEYMAGTFEAIELLKGDELPVSAMDPAGFVSLGFAAYEKREAASFVPEWDVSTCIQCMQCSLVCPHAAIRPYLATDDELKGAPSGFDTKDPVLPPLKGLHYRVQVYPQDCQGCGSCANNCPAPGKALFMKPIDSQLNEQMENLAFAQANISIKDDLMEPTTIQGTQLRQPLLEFSGACAGCGETPHVKLLTQLFGDRLIIANATGCSSIWGGYMPGIVYTTNKRGHGPAWANSLFEDNAEFGFGIAAGVASRRSKLIDDVLRVKDSAELSDEVKQGFEQWLEAKDDADKSAALEKPLREKVAKWIDDSGDKADASTMHVMQSILRHADLFAKKSIWCVGGDGWAYDIDFDGLDEVLAKGENINMLVLDTEGYSNTGGEMSKSTQLGSVSGFSLDGKGTPAKQLGKMMMAYDYVYVAQIALGANMMQAIKALREAESYDGPSIVIALCPCISWGIHKGMGVTIAEQKRAVKSGFWPLFRFNPALREQGKDPLTIDCQDPDGTLEEFLDGESRFASLLQREPKRAQTLHSELAKEVELEHGELERMVDVYDPGNARGEDSVSGEGSSTSGRSS